MFFLRARTREALLVANTVSKELISFLDGDVDTAKAIIKGIYGRILEEFYHPNRLADNHQRWNTQLRRINMNILLSIVSEELGAYLSKEKADIVVETFSTRMYNVFSLLEDIQQILYESSKSSYSQYLLECIHHFIAKSEKSYIDSITKLVQGWMNSDGLLQESEEQKEDL